MRKKPTVVGTSIVLFAAALAFFIPLINQARSEVAAKQCINNLRCVDGGKLSWAIELHQNTNTTPTWDDLVPFIVNCFYDIKTENGKYLPYAGPHCPKGGRYAIGTVAEAPTCTITNHDITLAPVRFRVKEGMHRIEGATVEVIDESGKRQKALTDRQGDAEIETWPNKAIAVIVSKEEYLTRSNTFPLPQDNGGGFQLKRKTE